MNFFKKNGRPSEEELMLIQSIEKIVIQKGIPENEIPDCLTLDDLIEVKLLMENFTPKIVQESNIESQNVENLIEEQEQIANENHEIVSENLEQNTDLNLEQHEKNTPNQEVKATNEPEFIADDYDAFALPIIERSYTGQQSGEQVKENPEDELILEDSNVKSPLEDLNPATKRRAAEQTADALLKGYARIVPQPFKWMAKISEDKVDKMAMRGEIDTSLEVQEGLSFEDYMRQTNAEIDELFEVQTETLDEIKEPLIDVLMEQQLELTPTQRLTMAVLSHLTQMFTVALKLRQQNNRILSFQRHITHLSRVKVA